MHLDIVTPDRKVVVGEASDVIIPALEGVVEVLPGHAGFLSLLGTGILSFVHQGKETKLMVSGGFVECDHDHVVIMAESAALAEEVTKERESKALSDAEAKLKALGAVAIGDENFKTARAEVDRAAAKLTLIR